MEYETFTGQTVAEAVALANLFADGPPEVAAVRDVLGLYGLGGGDVDLAAFEGLADRIRAVFQAPGEPERVARLNALLASYEPAPFIADHDGQGPHFHYVPDDRAAVRRVGASLTMALAHVVVDYGGERLGRCPAPGCRRVFVDTTRNRSQRYCSKTCATRVHVAEHRARR